MTERRDYRPRAREIYQANIDAGWWKQTNDDSTGSSGPLRTVPRNIGELLCLVHSEIDEAYHGHVYGLFDDHLPNELMARVELADTAIRAYDTLGYYQSKFPLTAPPGGYNYPSMMKPRFPDQCLTLHGLVTEAMEAFRKSNEVLGIVKLWHLLDCLYLIAEHRTFDLDTVMDMKLDYNRHRADHKLENRAKAGGKTF